MARSTGLAGPAGATTDTTRDGNGTAGPARAVVAQALAAHPGTGKTVPTTAQHAHDGAPAPDAGPVAEVVRRVRDTLEQVFTAVAETGADTSALLADVSEAGRAPVAADLAALRPGLRARLAALPLVSGVGFVAAPGLLADVPGCLEWWQRGPGGAVRPLLLDLDPEHSAYSDYTHWDWYTLPRETGRRAVAGPYVDYLCSDEYGLTLSAPVALAGRFVGVAAADVYLRHFEAAVLPALLRLPVPARLVNARGRVAASTDPAHLAGSLTKGPDFAAVLAGPQAGHHAGGLRLVPCGGVPLVLVTAAR
ncbi:cache domain-containing protein [Streptomyces sp. SS]|uniref:cache domain-containing protein n=1 Tax=Streptomyces sp. SS TaxID=260742 RepID=UPI0002D5B23C|nr:cache domain-containing protein [Streptomyces sp. SS]